MSDTQSDKHSTAGSVGIVSPQTVHFDQPLMLSCGRALGDGVEQTLAGALLDAEQLCEERAGSRELVWV